MARLALLLLAVAALAIAVRRRHVPEPDAWTDPEPPWVDPYTVELMEKFYGPGVSVTGGDGKTWTYRP